jgi:hypothetical protein
MELGGGGDGDQSSNGTHFTSVIRSYFLNLLSQGPYSFPHRGSLRWCEVFNEAEPK